MPRCLACRLGKGRDASHFRSPAVREAAQIQIDFCFLREDVVAYDVAEPVPGKPLGDDSVCSRRGDTETPCQGKVLSSSMRLGSSSASSKGSGTRNLVIRSDGEAFHYWQLWTGSWRRSRRQVCRHEFDQKKTPRYSFSVLGGSR